MLATEEYASTLWCPVGSTYRYGQGSRDVTLNDPQRPADQCRCIASGCNWWRWWEVEDAARPDRRRGFCGAAGKPIA